MGRDGDVEEEEEAGRWLIDVLFGRSPPTLATPPAL